MAQRSANDLTLVAERLLGTCGNTEAALETLECDADVNDVEDQLVDEAVERCSCGRWMRSWDLVDEDDEVVGCDDCRET